MMNEKDYLEQYDKHQSMRDNVAKDKNRLHYHLMPPTGWLNDPNGLCQKDGVYHVYFQYTPYDSGWGTKLWGHYTTTDMITFKQEQPFLYPDQDIDRDGVYSGSAFIEDDTIHYFYTGNIKLTDRDDYDYINEGRIQNTIHFTSKDGLKISEKELIMTNSDYPENMSKHVRDPKIFKKDKYYYMVIGARNRDNKGCVLLYRSLDLKNFEYYNIITTPEVFGYMWECPDLFELDGELFLICCPQGVEQVGYDYANIYQTGYFKVDYDFINNSYVLGKFKELDRGFDIYAPQSFLDEQGRRILYAWMGIPDASYHNRPTVEYDWQHALTMPRVLTYRDGQIYQSPLVEMENLRLDKYEASLDIFNQTVPTSVCFEMNLLFENNEDIEIQIRDDVKLVYQNQILTLSLQDSGCGRTTRSVEISNINEITVFSDTSSLEIFINQGQEVFTTRLYSSSHNQKVKLLTSNKGKVIFYPLKGYQIIK